MVAGGRESVVVIGIGSTVRGDDGLGPAAAELLAAEELTHVEVLALDGEPTRLIEAWAGRQHAVVIDAVRAGDEPGTIHHIESGSEPLPGWNAGASSHRAGLAEAVALGEALDRLPERLTVFGVEPLDLSTGAELSPIVQAALPELVRRVISDIRP